MRGIIRRWVLSRVIKSALTFETDSIELYERLTEELADDTGHTGPAKACRDDLHASLCHLLEEEREHWRLLQDAADGRLSLEELQSLSSGHTYGRYDAIEPLPREGYERWVAELDRALAQEEKTWIFYSNLRRMSKIPVVKRAFEVLAGMEKEHLEILRRLLGRG